MIVTAKKIRVMTPWGEEIIAPDTTANNWQLIEEHEKEMVIEVLDD